MAELQTVEPPIATPSQAEISQLEQLYTLREKTQILQFIEKHPFLLPLLLELPNKIKPYFIGVKQSIEYALEQGISTTQDVDKIVEQICYRAADLAVLLDRESKKLSDYSEQLRRTN